MPNKRIWRTVFEFNLRFFFPDLATIWDDSKVGIKITLWLGCQPFCYFFMDFIYEVFDPNQHLQIHCQLFFCLSQENSRQMCQLLPEITRYIDNSNQLPTFLLDLPILH